MDRNSYDVVIIGGGISGVMMAKRLNNRMPDFSILIINKSPEIQNHAFHLHRYIEEIPALSSQHAGPMTKFVVNLYNEKGFQPFITIPDINRYALNIFGFLNITNIRNIEDMKVLPIGKLDLMKIMEKGTNYDYRAGVVSRIDTENKIVKITGENVDAIIEYKYLINTISLPILLDLANIQHSLKFDHYPFWSISLPVGYHTHCHQMFMCTHSACNISRVMLMDDQVHIEALDDHITAKDREVIQQAFGIPIAEDVRELNSISPGRIHPVTKEHRKPLIHWLTATHNIFTIGRYGAWTHKIANDVWDDTEFICDLIFSKEQATIYEDRR